MTSILRGIALAATYSLVLMPAAFAQDAMAADPMAPMAVTPITDAQLASCIAEAEAISFREVGYAAVAACHGLHRGMDVMGAVDAMQGGDAMMATDAMAPTP